MACRLFNKYKLVMMRSELVYQLDYIEINQIIDQLYSKGVLHDEKKKILYCTEENENRNLRNMLGILERRVDLEDRQGNTKIYDFFMKCLNDCDRQDLVEMFEKYTERNLLELLEYRQRSDLDATLKKNGRQDLVEILENGGRQDLVEILKQQKWEEAVRVLKSCKLQDLVKELKVCNRLDLVEKLKDLEGQCVAQIINELEGQELVKMLISMLPKTQAGMPRFVTQNSAEPFTAMERIVYIYLLYVGERLIIWLTILLLLFGMTRFVTQLFELLWLPDSSLRDNSTGRFTAVESIDSRDLGRFGERLIICVAMLLFVLFGITRLVTQLFERLWLLDNSFRYNSAGPFTAVISLVSRLLARLIIWVRYCLLARLIIWVRYCLAGKSHDVSHENEGRFGERLIIWVRYLFGMPTDVSHSGFVAQGGEPSDITASVRKLQRMSDEFELKMLSTEIESIAKASENIPLTNEMLREILKCIGSGWRMVALHLGMTQIEIDQATEEDHDPNEQKLKVFLEWKIKNNIGDGGLQKFLTALESTPEAIVDWEGIVDLVRRAEKQ